MSRKQRSPIVWVLSCSVVVLLLSPFLGLHPIHSDLLSGESELANRIFWSIRIPRVLLGFLAGAALGLGGMVYQALFRNELATPFTLGVASGASFGSVLGIWLGVSGSFLGISLLHVMGLFGALLATVLVYGFSYLRRHTSPSTMLLAGVAMGFFFSSLILFLQYMSDFSQSFQVIRWLMGGLEIVGYTALWQLLPFVGIGSIIIFLLSREIDILSTGEELASSRGVDVTRVRLILYFSVSLMIGGVVSVTGPIGFIGMMVPHFCRQQFGHQHVRLTPLVFLVAGSFLVLCDTFARIVIAPAELPVGVVTALLGGPVFLWILFRKS